MRPGNHRDTPQASTMTMSQGLQKAVYLLRAGKPAAAQGILGAILKVAPRNFNALHLSGQAEFELRNFEKAVEFFEYAIDIRGDLPRVHYRLGIALKNLERYDEATNSFRRAVALKPNYSEAHNNLGNTLLELTQHDKAIKSFRRALKLKPNYPEAHNNLGNTLLKLKQHDKAIKSFRRALELKPNFPEAHNNLGIALLELKQHDKAIKSFRRALELKPNYPEAHNNLGIALLRINQHGEAIKKFRRALELKPSYGEARSQLASEEIIICDWTRYAQTSAMVRGSVNTNQEAISPFVFLAFSDNPAEQLECARRYGLEKTGAIRPLEPISLRPSDRRIRIAYLSADLREHATAYLMSELFELHDRDKFEPHAVSFGTEKEDGMRARLKRAFEHWHNVREKSDHEIARLIRNQGIEIAVDLKGYTKDARPGILAHRPAPIQVNYLGYPGTMGVTFIDYILADDFVAGADQQDFFTEKLVQLPNSYQSNDAKRAIATETPSRSACGLPDKGFVFCCFNNNWKITPTLFDIWMKLLSELNDSVLWLLEDNKWAKKNLRREALQRGVDPERIVFAPRLPLAQHLARQRLADLFVDTLPCNAHTTASDALWAGLPVLTCAGQSFHARVAGSLLRAASLPELVTTNLKDYQALATKLAREPALLASYRQRLSHNREIAPLFDATRFTRNLETAYLQMSQRWREGRHPVAFSVSDSARS